MLLFSFDGLLLFQFAARRLFQLLFQPPPRSTLSAYPYYPLSVGSNQLSGCSHIP
jgi:hypothetical protein